MGVSGHAVNTSLYAYHPLSLRMIVLKRPSKPVGDIMLHDSVSFALKQFLKIC